MREIKFRAWDKNKGEMILNDSFYEFQRWNRTASELENFEIMQYTGIFDKNGQEIYEGDILENTAVVCFQRGRFQPVYDGGNAEEMEDNFYLFASKSEIIGNIYENPELLK